MSTILFFRGLEANLPASAPAGEPLFCTDSGKLFMGTGAGRVQIGGGGSITDPSPQSYTPGSFTVATGKYVILSKRLQLTGAQRASFAGTARLRVT